MSVAPEAPHDRGMCLRYVSLLYCNLHHFDSEYGSDRPSVEFQRPPVPAATLGNVSA